MAGRSFAAAMICISLMFTASCAITPETRPKGPAELTWERFIAQRSQLRRDVRAIEVKSSINLDTPERKTRLIITFWGNLDYPLRLDLSTGFGAPVAYSREDRLGFTAYDPNANTAFISENSRRGARILGLTMPFDLQDLASLAAGTFLNLLPVDYVTVEPAEAGWRYFFGDEAEIRSATLDAGSRLTQLSGTGDTGPWTMSLTNYNEGSPQATSRPEKLIFEAGDDVKAVLRIKDMRRLAEIWSAKSLELPLPPGTRTRILEP